MFQSPSVNLPLGIKIIVIPVPTMKIQAKKHKRKSSRRWQKKWLKRFGWKWVTSPYYDPDKFIFDQQRNIFYVYPHQQQQILNMIAE